MKFLIAGDFFIANHYEKQQLIDDSVRNLFETADYRIVNLETPLTANEPKNRIKKTGPHLQSLADNIIPYLRQLKIDLVTLANNLHSRGIETHLDFSNLEDIATTVGYLLSLSDRAHVDEIYVRRRTAKPF